MWSWNKIIRKMMSECRERNSSIVQHQTRDVQTSSRTPVKLEMKKPLLALKIVSQNLRPNNDQQHNMGAFHSRFHFRYDYVLAREYNWNVKNKATMGYEETYFFVMRPEGVFFNELETRCVVKVFVNVMTICQLVILAFDVISLGMAKVCARTVQNLDCPRQVVFR